MSLALLKEKRIERKKIVDAAGAMLTVAAKEKRAFTKEEDAQFEQRHADGDRMLKEIEQLERQITADAASNAVPNDERRAGKEDFNGRETELPPATEEEKKKADREERRVLRKWMAGGEAVLDGADREVRSRRIVDLTRLSPENRALSAQAGASGAYTIPQSFEYQLDVALKYYGGIITDAEYIPTDDGRVLPYPSMNDTANAGEIIGENSAVAGASGGAAEQDPAYGVLNFSAYMFDSGIVLIPVQLIQDAAFDPESYIQDALRTRLGRKLNTACTTGLGVNGPRGVVVAATTGVTAASTSAVAYTEILGLVHSIDPAYRVMPGVGFEFNDSTLLALKKLSDGNGRPLWIAGGVSEGVQNKEPDQFAGYKYSINQDMASIATGNASMVFGLLKKYKIRRVRETQLIRFGERFMDKLQIGFMAFQRYDGNLVDAGTHPVKTLVHP